MNKKVSNFENVVRDKLYFGKLGSECDSVRKENFFEDGGDMEFLIEGMVIFFDLKGWDLYFGIIKILKKVWIFEDFWGFFRDVYKMGFIKYNVIFSILGNVLVYSCF